jgi:hypothetical protein
MVEQAPSRAKYSRARLFYTIFAEVLTWYERWRREDVEITRKRRAAVQDVPGPGPYSTFSGTLLGFFAEN